MSDEQNRVVHIHERLLRQMDRRVERVEKQVDDLGARLLEVERDVAGSASHRVRHEIRLGELSNEIERLTRRKEMIRDDDPDR